MGIRCAVSISVLVAAALAAAAPAAGAAPDASSRAERLEALVDATVPADGPGLALVVLDANGIVFERYRGLADLDWGVPIGPHSRFYLASLSKQLTAATVASLVLDGTLSLDQRVRTIVPELPPYADRVTIGDLVHHTSGLRDYLKIRQIAGQPDEEPFDNRTVLEILARQRSLVFQPGSRYQYSNSNYVLLAELVGRVTGRPFEAVVRERVLAPAGLDDTGFEIEARRPLARRVTSYRTRRDVGPLRYFKAFDAFGDGGAYGTPRDLARWVGILLRRDTLDPALLDLILTPDPRAPDRTYAFGLFVRSYRGVRLVEHGGSMLGFEHWIAILPDQGLAFVLLTNDKSIDTLALRPKLIEILAGDAVEHPTPPAEPPAPSRTEPALVPEYAPLPDAVLGTYHNDEIPVDLTIERRDGALLLTPSTFRTVPLERTGPDTLSAFHGEFRLRIERATAESPVLVLENDDLGSFVFEKLRS